MTNLALDDQIDKQRLGKIINDYIYSASANQKKQFPTILSDNHQTTVHYITPDFLLTSFISSEDEERIKKYIEKGYEPYPGLLAGKNIDTGIAIKMGGKFNNFKNNTVKYLFSFKVGKNTSFVIDNHTQYINTDKLGSINYVVKLAYVIGFGELTTIDDFYDDFKDLILYSIEKWGII